MKIDVIKVAKVVGMVLSVGGMVVSGWASDKTAIKALDKLVDERLGKN